MVSKAVIPVTALALVLAACGSSNTPKSATSSSETPTSASGTSLTVTQKEYSLGLSSSAARAGKVSVKVVNSGALEHEFVAFKTDLAEAALPLVADGSQVDEKAGITHLDPEAEEVKPGTSKSITIDFAPGRYVVICNVPTHYKLGMHAVLTVT